MRFGLAVFAAWLCVALPAAAMSRVDEIVNVLQVICMLEPLNFDRLNQRATAMQMKVLTDFESPAVNGATVRSKTWLMGMKGGPLAFSAGDGRGVPRPATNCAISAPDVTLDEMRSALAATLHLQEPRILDGRDGGPPTVIWDKGLGDGTKLMLTVGRFRLQPGFNLIYEEMQAQTGR